MTNKIITFLALTAAIVMAATVYLSQQPSVEPPTEIKHWLSEVQQNKANLTAVKIYSPDNQLIVDAQLVQDNWLMQNAAGYQIKTESLAKWYNQLLTATNIEAKTAKAENFARLGLVNPADITNNATNSEGTGHLVVLTIADTEHKLILGDAASSGQFARLATQQQTWLLDQYVSVPAQASDWLNSKVFDFDSAQIEKLQSSSTTQTELNWTISKAVSEDNDGEFILENKPAERELTYSGVVNSHVNSIANLNFSDVQAYNADLWQNKAELAQLSITLQEGQNVTVYLLEQEQQTSLLVDNGTEPKWQYVLAGYQSSLVLKPLESFLQAITEPAPAE